MKVLQNLFLVTGMTLFIASCGDTERAAVSVPLEYSEQLIDELQGTDFSIVLNDMNVAEEDGKDLFQHKYHGIFWYWMLSRRSYQRDYAGHRAYSTAGRTYYGNNANGTTTYGTNSAYQKTKRSSFFTRRSTSSTWKSFSTRKSASSSRYNGASTTRSKSGGFGK